MTGAPATNAPEPPRAGGQERHLAIGAIAQQAAYVVSTLVMLGVITALARTLSLSAFGTYGLLVSFATYLLVAQGSIEVAAIKAIAEARERAVVDQVVSTAVFLYAVFGLAAGLLIAGIGIPLLGLFDIPSSLLNDARIGLVALAVVTLVGWPTKVSIDILRANQLFVVAAASEIIAWLAFGGVFAGLLIADAPFWTLVAAGGAGPLFVGTAATIALFFQHLPFRIRRSAITSASVRSFLNLSGLLLIMSAADLVVYSLDRVVLGAFRSAATVGLYEGPVRAHNLVRQVQGVLVSTVLPAASTYIAEGDRERVRELLLRGTRYVLLFTTPIVVVFMTLAEPILKTWLGPKFAVGATAMTILVGYWLLAINTNVAGSMLVAAGRVRVLAIYAWVLAVLNLALSLALTPSLGLNGVVLGTTIPQVVCFPVFMVIVLRAFPEVRLRDFAREAWLPAYGTGAVLAGVLIAARVLLPLDTIAAVFGVALVGVAGYLAATYVIWLRPGERTLVQDVIGTALAYPRRRLAE